MLLSTSVKVKWHGNNRKWYENKGHIFTKIGDEFEVKIEDLSDNNNNIKVKVKCDYENCKNPNIKFINYYIYKNSIHKHGKYYCKNCATELFARDKIKKTRLKNGKSFEQWCIDNNRENVLERWDYELNDLKPSEILYSANKYMYFKCPRELHNSELKSINDFTHGQEGSMNCNQCNAIITTHPELVRYFVNKEDTYKYSYGSQEKVNIICPNCKHIKNMYISSLVKHGMSCPKCGDGISYPEKFMFSLLEQLLNDNFQAQLSKTTFIWCDNYKYDFYIQLINGIIETNGIQHYKEFNRSQSLKEIQENDKIKKQLAKDNNIENYIIIDCRYSELEWIKSSIMNSELPTLLNFKEEDIDWLKCHECGLSSLVKEACDLWNKGMDNVLLISNKLKLSRSTITRYLKQGTILGWCNYDAKEELRKGGILTRDKNRNINKEK